MRFIAPLVGVTKHFHTYTELPRFCGHAAMSVILSKQGSVRGLEGGVGKAVDSFREKTKRLNGSSVLQRIQEVEILACS